MSFTERKVNADAHELAIQHELERRGWHVEPFGIGMLQPTTRDHLHTVQPPTFWRWLPDLIASRDGRVVLVDGKGEQRNDTPNFAIETMAILAHRSMSVFGVPIVYVFSDMSCNWLSDEFLAGAVRWYTPEPGRHRVHSAGSGTPFVLVPKSAQLHMDDVFGAAYDDPDSYL